MQLEDAKVVVNDALMVNEGANHFVYEMINHNAILCFFLQTFKFEDLIMRILFILTLSSFKVHHL